MAHDETGTTEPALAPDAERSDAPGRRLGIASLAVAPVAGGAWLAWRGGQLAGDPIPLALFSLELIGVVAGLVVGAGLWRLSSGDRVPVPAGPLRYHDVVTRSLGRTATDDLRLRARIELGNVMWRPAERTGAVLAVAALSDPVRRAAQLLLVAVSLLRGIGPYPPPPPWAVGCLVLGIAATSCSHVLLSGGRIRPGDRVRWSYAAMGDLVRPPSTDQLPSQRWVSVVGAAVLLCSFAGLRGTSDRWTHGLAPMDHDERTVVLVVAMVLVVGALLALRSMSAPEQPDSHVVARRLEERTARQSALGGAICVGLVGLVAGVLPGSVDAADHDVTGIEQITDRDTAGGGDVVDE